MLAATLLTALPARALQVATSVKLASWLPIALPRNAQSTTVRPVPAPAVRAVCSDIRSPVMELAFRLVEIDAQTASLQESVPNAKVDTSSTIQPISARWIAV